MTPLCHSGNRSSILLRAAKNLIVFSVRMSSTDKMRKLLEKTYNYQVKIDDNLQKFDKLLDKHFSNLIDKSKAQRIFLTDLSDWYHINYNGIWIIDAVDFIEALEEKIKIYWENYQCKDWQEFQEDFIDKCDGY